MNTWDPGKPMAEIINLNKVRKMREKAESEDQAKQNRITFGRKKNEKKTDAQNRSKQSKDLDDRKLE